MGRRGGQEAGGAVHVHIGLPGVGAVEAREIDDAHQPGEVHGLDAGVLERKKGELLFQLVIDLGAALQNLLPGHGEQALFVPLHIIGCGAELLGKILCHRQQVLLGHRLGGDPGQVLEAVRPEQHAPQQAEPGVDAQAGTQAPQHRAVGPLSPVPLCPGDGGDAPCRVGQPQQDCQDIHHLHDGDVRPVAQPSQGPLDREGHIGSQTVHPGPAAPGEPKGCQQD